MAPRVRRAPPDARRAAGKGRNPSNGAEIDIPASTSARFKPGATLKTELNQPAAAKGKK